MTEGPKSSTKVENQTSRKLPNPAESSGGAGVLHQRGKLPICPAKLALGGVAIVMTIGYFTLYSHKKPEATALDVAKVSTGVASAPDQTRPRN